MVINQMKFLVLIFSILGTSISFAAENFNFEDEYVRLQGELNKAVFNNYASSRDYEDKKIPLSEKLQSKKAWCELNKAHLNLMNLVSDHFTEYKELMRINNIDDDSTIEKVKESQSIFKGHYERSKAALNDTDYKCE